MSEKRIVTKNEYLILLVENAIRTLKELIDDFERDGLENQHLKQELTHLKRNLFELKGNYQ